jgi:hypothetical protein
MTTDDALLRGAQFARDHLRVIEAAYGAKVAMAYAGGMATGCRNVVAHEQGVEAAWTLYDGLASDLLTQALEAK